MKIYIDIGLIERLSSFKDFSDADESESDPTEKSTTYFPQKYLIKYSAVITVYCQLVKDFNE